MSRKTLTIGGLLVAVALIAAVAMTSSANPVEDLEKKVAQLESKVQQLEAQIKSMNTRLSAAVPDPKAEQEAGAALAAIEKAVAEGEIDSAKSQLGEFSKKYSNTKVARRATQLGAELAVVGKDAPSDWGIDTWFQGKSEVDLDSDKATLIVFWETWCPHCRREVPKLQATYDKFKGKGLQVVGLTKITKSATEEGVSQFIQQQKVGYPVAKENGKTSSYFNVRGIPAAAVTKGGKVIWRGHPARITEQMLDNWL